MVTAETAVVLPVLMVVLLASLWVIACVAAQLRCVDAARVAARAAARGDTASSVRAVALAVGPPGAAVATTETGSTVTVVVSADVRPFGRVLAVLPPTPVSARATAVLEAAP